MVDRPERTPAMTVSKPSSTETGHHQPVASPDFGYRALSHGASPTQIRMEASL